MEVKEIFLMLSKLYQRNILMIEVFTENFNYDALKEAGIDFKSVQDNLSFQSLEEPLGVFIFKNLPMNKLK